MTLVKIDPSSVKKNPNAGCRDYWVDHGSTSTLDIGVCDAEITDHLEKNFNARVVSMRSFPKSGIQESKFRLINANFEPIFAYLKSKGVAPEKMHVNTQFHNEHVTSLTPEPEYFYQYEDTEVECSECKAKFKRSELVDNSDYDYEGNSIGSACTCPKCGEFDCCQLQFERFVKP